jgi:hypothetical protein
MIQRALCHLADKLENLDADRMMPKERASPLLSNILGGERELFKHLFVRWTCHSPIIMPRV